MSISKAKFLWLLVLSLLIIPQQSQASHDIGGEIWWECLNDGKFVFYAKMYRDCSGIPSPFVNKTLEVFGNPLPRNNNNASLSTIILKPDSALWLSQNMGDLSPNCNEVGGLVLKCINGDHGSYQVFPYKSDPITLKGIPPSNGWRFVLRPPCCRPFITNLAGSGESILTSIMYPDIGNNPIDICYNSSPKFAEEIDYFTCSGDLKSADHRAIDLDNDSIVYSLYRTYNSPVNSPTPVPYAPGYDFNNPTSDQSFDSSNVPSYLDPRTGTLSYAMHNLNSYDKKYFVVIRVDEYRMNSLISSVFREYPIYLKNCPINFTSTKLEATAMAGESTISINESYPNYSLMLPVNSKLKLDLNSFMMEDSLVSNLGSKTQFKVSSLQFSSSPNDISSCNQPPCASFKGLNSNFDSLAQSYIGNTTNTYSKMGTIEWIPNCQHLDSLGFSKIYQFNVQRITEFCDTIEVKNEIINVEVVNAATYKPEIECLNFPNNFEFNLSWDTIGLPPENFVHWSIYSSRPSGGVELIDTIQDYYFGFGNSKLYNRLDTSFSPQIFVNANYLNCNKEIVSLNSDTLSRRTSIRQVGNELVVELDPPGSNYYVDWAECDPITGYRSSNIVMGDYTYTPPDSGYYNAYLGSPGPPYQCAYYTECIYYRLAVGIEEFFVLDELEFFPNPSNGLIFIEGVSQTLDFQIFNIQGKLMKRGRFGANQNQLELPEAEGLYFVSFRDEEGNEKTYKLVKQ